MCKRVDVNFLLIYFLHSFQTHLVSLLWSWFCSRCSLILKYCLLLRSHILLIHTYPNASHSSRLKPYGISSQESFSTSCISFLGIHLTPDLCLCIDMILCFIINVCVFSFLLDSELLWGGKCLYIGSNIYVLNERKVMTFSNITDEDSFQGIILNDMQLLFLSLCQ